MAGHSNLVVSLVRRLATSLPHRTGSSDGFDHHDLAGLTRNALVDISNTSIGEVVEALLQQLRELSSQYHSFSSHPTHVIYSEFYILHLIADCCTAHWDNVNGRIPEIGNTQNPGAGTYTSDAIYNARLQANGRASTVYAPQNHPFGIRSVSPLPLDESLAGKLLSATLSFLAPISEAFVLPATVILDDEFSIPATPPNNYRTSSESSSASTTFPGAKDNLELLRVRSHDIERDTRTILEFLSASNWAFVFEFLKVKLREMRTSQSGQSGNTQHSLMAEDDRNFLISLRVIASLWVDARKLGTVIQELCGSFLHLRKPFQHTVGIVLPLLITRWLERNPQEFEDLHVMHKKLDGGADTLFDMTNTVTDNGKEKSIFYPLQTSVLFLLPDVWEVATGMRDVKSSSMAKKMSFLDGLRKAMRNRNSTAAYCLVSLLRVARHFDLDSDSALLSYALDVQDEIREAIFRRFSPGIDAAVFDCELLTAAFVSISHLNFEACKENLAPLCLATSSPQDFKIAFVSACCHFARQPNAESFQPMFSLISPFIHSYLRDSTRPRQGIGNSQTSLESTLVSSDLTYYVLTFLDLWPRILKGGDPAQFEISFTAFIPFLRVDEERIWILANKVAVKVVESLATSTWQRTHDADFFTFPTRFWKITSAVLYNISDRIIDEVVQRKRLLVCIHDYLDARLKFLKTDKEVASADENIPERLAASAKLETTLLILLCSSDINICQLATACIALLCEESKVIDDALQPVKTSANVLKNFDAYVDLSSRDFRVTGIVAFQKRQRSIFRRMKQPSPGILAALDIAFGKWYELSLQMTTARSGQMSTENSFVEWRNFSGFLSSLGGACMSERGAIIDETTLTGVNWIERPSQESYNEAWLDRYLTQSILLLACSNVRIREATRDVLSYEISPMLYISLFRILESQLDALFEVPDDRVSGDEDTRYVFAEQAAALLKTIVERLSTPEEIDAALSINIGALTLNFVRFLSDASDAPSILKIRLKVCQLCEVIMRKKELLNLRHDVRIRNQLLDIMFGWIARPVSPATEASISKSNLRTDEALRLQKDLDKACLKALAGLTHRLPLQPGDSQSDAETSDLKLQMFRTYFNRFLSLLTTEKLDRIETLQQGAGNRDEQTAGQELAINALSNLLSSNIDVGLKHSLSIGYHEDLKIRTAFVKVLCNILAQGAEFANLSDTTISEKYDQLLKLLLGNVKLVVALCDACPSTEVDELTISLLNIFDSRGLGFMLLRALIEHEVVQTENEAELLRRNCVTTKMLSIYAKWKGSAYLKATLQKVLERLIATAKDLNLELDPSRTASEDELQKNALQLRIVTKAFIDDICSSAVRVPVSFRKICSIISSSVMTRFPEAKFTAVGAFIFLRFFCPAIVAPEVEGLISSPPSKDMRRGLLLIAKVIQNLANNVLFGAKESYMFPLNDFLTQNIYRVTAFLREISDSPSLADPGIAMEPFDFGSCVALHRYLYDHWDHVRQKLIAQERQSSVHSPLDVSQGRLPILESIRTLISDLGPPPTDISWNRPLISSNNPPSYSRFQHFMLRNSGRSSESLISTRVVYDGGESKDGLSIICIILRNTDNEAIDYDLLLYCYLKIASRMWHKPFGLLIDATCYNGHNEPQDTLFRKLDLLTPAELSKGLSRVYVYNMNSAFRKCFRRILRLSSKSENSPFHPSNVDYHLIGSLPDLQSHFHLSQLNLPKETISVVTDTRFVYQPVTRLSKTKGKIEVVIKVGSQFVQVTTTKKQEIVTGLRLHATVNDIFRLTEVDEAPTSIQTEDDSAFGLRTESGKIVMYFTSARKLDILSAIRMVKSKNSKEQRAPATFERLIRPQDVPGTLLNIALTNMASLDHTLRLSSYNLLCALCKAFKFDADISLLAAEELCVPRNPSNFIVSISSELALSQPQMTVDFLKEFFAGWESFPLHQRALSIAYMAPWLSNLRSHAMIAEADVDKAKEKLSSIFRKLINVAIADPSLGLTLEHYVWPAIYNDEIHTEIFLEELIKMAVSFGAEDDNINALGTILASLATVTIRGKLLSRLRKVLNRTSLRPTRYLSDNAVWPELCAIVRLCLLVSFESGMQSQLFMPELFHVITMLTDTGSCQMRATIHRLLVNTLHAVCTTFTLEEARLTRLKAILASLVDLRGESLGPLLAVNQGGLLLTQSHESATASLATTEALASLLSEVSIIAAPITDLSNAWRARWMSLVASTAFQTNPAIQPRAFTVMGCLASEDVDDDLLYQVLIALKNSISRLVEENDHEMLVAIVTSLTKMMKKLSTASRYGIQLFWLAISLVRLLPLSLFNFAALFLEAVLININASGEFRNGRIATVLLHGRLSLDEVAVRLDESYGIHFNIESFHFAVNATLVKGLSDPITKATTIRVLSAFLEIGSSNALDGCKFPAEMSCVTYLSLILPRATTSEEAKNILWLAGVTSDANQAIDEVFTMVDMASMKDKELLLNVAIRLVDFLYLEETIQNRTLRWLIQVTLGRPTVMLHLISPIMVILDDILISCHHAETLESAHTLLRTLNSDPALSGQLDTSLILEDVLEDIGFGGLWGSSTFHATNEPGKRRAMLTDKLIELIIA